MVQTDDNLLATHRAKYISMKSSPNVVKGLHVESQEILYKMREEHSMLEEG